MEKLETIAVIIADQDPQRCLENVNDFCKSKDPDRIRKYWSVNVLPVGANKLASGFGLQTMPIAACLIHWDATKEQADSFKMQQKLLLNKNGISH